jgi:hypothetical protein
MAVVSYTPHHLSWAVSLLRRLEKIEKPIISHN